MNRSTLVRGAVLYGARVCYGLLLLAASVIIARLYGPYGLGVYALLLTLTNLGGIIAVFGINTVIIERLPILRLRPDADVAVPRYLRSALAFVTVSGVIATALSAVVAWIVVPDLRWAAVTVLFIAWSTLFLSFLLSEHRQVLAASLESVMRPAVYVALLVALGLAGAGYQLTISTALIASLGLLAVVSGALYLRVALRKAHSTRAPHAPGLDAEPESSSEPAVVTRAHAGHGGIYMLIALMTAGAQQLDRFVLELLTTTDEVGIYSSAQNVMNIVTYAMLALMSLLLPAIAEWQAGSLNEEEFTRRCRLVSRALTALAGLVVLACVIGGDYILGIFGSDFLPGRNALIVLAAGQLVSAALGVASTVLSIGQHRLMALALVTGTVIVNVVLCFVFIPMWGITGAALANAVALVSNRLAGHIILKRRRGLSLTAW
ncbi:MAG: polysaccharide biosynthesis C-terminal domain-containing protein [Actinomycetia bacterium]|nr:polysaccharide biosynthesis C-terminal domain-containing protein [Actinomycetes bacterium]